MDNAAHPVKWNISVMDVIAKGFNGHAELPSAMVHWHRQLLAIFLASPARRVLPNPPKQSPLRRFLG
jgi:hypothetical protein